MPPSGPLVCCKGLGSASFYIKLETERAKYLGSRNGSGRHGSKAARAWEERWN